MKTVIAFCLLLCGNLYAQEDDLVLDSLKTAWLAELEQEADARHIGMFAEDTEGWLSGFSDSIYNQYQRDTFLLEGMFKRQLEYDQSTYGMVMATNDLEIGYDGLLNRYYKLLLNRLDKADREVLRVSQRNWIAFRDSEYKLSNLLTEERYSGGGTIQMIVNSSAYLEITKHRTEEIYFYLLRLVGK